jgi:hypothetical protein
VRTGLAGGSSACFLAYTADGSAFGLYQIALFIQDGFRLSFWKQALFSQRFKQPYQGDNQVVELIHCHQLLLTVLVGTRRLRLSPARNRG